MAYTLIMIKLFLDIETIPSADEEKEAHLSILRKRNSNSDKTDEEIHNGTNFEGTFGRICCIGLIKEGPQGVIFKGVLRGDEKEMLIKFWELSKDVWRFVGHNLWGFDLPFIYKRSIIHAVRPRELSFARYRNVPIYDTMQEWELWNFGKGQKLDTLARVLGFKSPKDEMDGSMVWDYYKSGRIDDICRYCMKDVEVTRQVYKRMTFEEDTTSEIPF